MMRDITRKTSTLRTAKAGAIVYCSESTMEAVRKKTVPKGDVLEFARAAGFLGAKNTPHLIPHCHPIPIDSMEFEFQFLDEDNYKSLTSLHSYQPGIVIQCEAKCIAKTGIEMEVLTAVSIAALTIYDILKPIDADLEISEIRLLEKTGGKSDRKYFDQPPTCAVLVCSDSAASGTRKDTSGTEIQLMLIEHGAAVIDYEIVADEKLLIQKKIKEWVSRDIHFIFTTGGTGLSPRDATVDAVEEIVERKANGIVETMRAHGQDRTPFAMMSRSVAGTIGSTLIVTLPGSEKGAKESLDAILPAIFHARKMITGGGH